MLACRTIFCLQVWANQSLLSRAPAFSCFYSTPGRGKTTVRFAFAKKLETRDVAVARLRAYRG